MAERMINGDGSVAVPTVDISIVNEKSAAVEIVRINPTTFDDERILGLAPGQVANQKLSVTDCLVAKVGNEVVLEFGVCDEIHEWRLHDDQAPKGHRCTFLVENRRTEAVNIFCTEGDNAEPILIRTLDAGGDAVLESFSGDYWEAKIGDRVVSAYQPSARRPVWTLTDVNCDFVPDLPTLGNENLNEVSVPRPIDQVATGDVKAVMVFVDFPDVPGTGALEEIKQQIVGDASDWFKKESYGRLRFAVETPFLQWRRMPRNATDYASIKHDGDAHRSYISTALKLFSKEEVNFDDYKIAYVVAAKTPVDDPRYQEVLHNSPTLSAGIAVDTNNGTVHHAVTFGRDSYGRGWHVLVHETGHLFGLPDLYLFKPTDWLAPVGPWDIMCDLDGGRHFLGWHKYKLGWLDESQLLYLKSSEISLLLNGFETAQGVKMMVLPTDKSSKLYVAEVAQSLGDSREFSDKGILVYTVDAAVETGKQPVCVVSGRDKKASADDTRKYGDFCALFMVPGTSEKFDLGNGEVIEVFNEKQVGTAFQVRVRPVPAAGVV